MPTTSFISQIGATLLAALASATYLLAAATPFGLGA